MNDEYPVDPVWVKRSEKKKGCTLAIFIAKYGYRLSPQVSYKPQDSDKWIQKRVWWKEEFEEIFALMVEARKWMKENPADAYPLDMAAKPNYDRDFNLGIEERDEDIPF